MSLFSTQSDTNKRLAVQKKTVSLFLLNGLQHKQRGDFMVRASPQIRTYFPVEAWTQSSLCFYVKCDSTHVLITIATSSPGKKHESLRKWCSVNDWRMSVGVSVFLIAIGFPLRRSKLLLLRLQTLPAPRHSLHCEPLSVVERVDKMR